MITPTVQIPFNTYLEGHPHSSLNEPESQPEPIVDYKALYEQSQAQLSTALALNKAKNSSPHQETASRSTAANTTYSALLAQMPPYKLDRLPDAELAAIFGLPSPPSKEECLAIFGNRADTRTMNHLYQSDPRRYHQLKEYGRARRWL